MDQGQGTSRTAVAGTETPETAAGPEELQREIEETRTELGETVEALAAKTDVKAQAKRKIEDTKSTVSEKKDQLLGKAKQASPDGASVAATQAAGKARENPAPVMAMAAFVAGVLTGRMTKRKPKNKQ